nr:hypothetical protein [Pusillimonas sp. ANT_WB101]
MLTLQIVDRGTRPRTDDHVRHLRGSPLQGWQRQNSAAGRSRNIVPTVYREDYLFPLKSLSNHADTGPYMRAMPRIQAWTAAFDYNRPRHLLHEALKRCNAFEEDLRNYRLVFPEADAGMRL